MGLEHAFVPMHRRLLAVIVRCRRTMDGGVRSAREIATILESDTYGDRRSQWEASYVSRGSISLAWRSFPFSSVVGGDAEILHDGLRAPNGL